MTGKGNWALISQCVNMWSSCMSWEEENKSRKTHSAYLLIYYLISPFDYIPFFEIETIKVIITNLVGLFQFLFRTILKLYQSYKAHIVRCTEVQRLVKGEKISSLDTIPRLIFSHHCTHAVDRKVFIRGHLQTTFTRRWVSSPRKSTFCQLYQVKLNYCS